MVPKTRSNGRKNIKKSFMFQNPLHHKTLEAALGIDPTTNFSVIVFFGDSTFKTKLPDKEE